MLLNAVANSRAVPGGEDALSALGLLPAGSDEADAAHVSAMLSAALAARGMGGLLPAAHAAGLRGGTSGDAGLPPLVRRLYRAHLLDLEGLVGVYEREVRAVEAELAVLRGPASGGCAAAGSCYGDGAADGVVMYASNSVANAVATTGTARGEIERLRSRGRSRAGRAGTAGMEAGGGGGGWGDGADDWGEFSGAETAGDSGAVSGSATVATSLSRLSQQPSVAAREALRRLHSRREAADAAAARMRQLRDAPPVALSESMRGDEFDHLDAVLPPGAGGVAEMLTARDGFSLLGATAVPSAAAVVRSSRGHWADKGAMLGELARNAAVANVLQDVAAAHLRHKLTAADSDGSTDGNATTEGAPARGDVLVDPAGVDWADPALYDDLASLERFIDLRAQAAAAGAVAAVTAAPLKAVHTAGPTLGPATAAAAVAVAAPQSARSALPTVSSVDPYFAFITAQQRQRDELLQQQQQEQQQCDAVPEMAESSAAPAAAAAAIGPEEPLVRRVRATPQLIATAAQRRFLPVTAYVSDSKHPLQHHQQLQGVSLPALAPNLPAAPVVQSLASALPRYAVPLALPPVVRPGAAQQQQHQEQLSKQQQQQKKAGIDGARQGFVTSRW